MAGRPKTRAKREAAKRGGQPGNENGVKHGFYVRFVDEPTRVSFEQRYANLLADPRACLLADAALLMTRVRQVIESAPATDGVLLMESEETTGVGPQGAIDLRRQRRSNVLDPASSALWRAASIVEKAMAIDPMQADLSLARLRELNAKAALAEKEARDSAGTNEPIEIIVREYKEHEPLPDEGAAKKEAEKT